jgi:hypothetical protein
MYPAPFETVSDPDVAPIVRHINGLFMNAYVDAISRRGIEGDAPDRGRGKSGIPELPGPAQVLGYRHSQSPTGYGDAFWRHRVKSDVGDILIHSQTSTALECTAAIGRCK